MKWITPQKWVSPHFIRAEIEKYYDDPVGLVLPNGDFLRRISGRYVIKIDPITGATTNLWDYGSWVPGLEPYLLTNEGRLLLYKVAHWGETNSEWWLSNDGTLTTFTKLLSPPSPGYIRPLSRHSIAKGNNIMLYGWYNVQAAVDAGETEVKLTRSLDGGETWETCFTFPHVNNPNPELYSEDPIQHIHCVEYDPYEEVFWIGTGDIDYSSRMYKTVDGITLELVGRGYADGFAIDDGQLWRATSIQFFPGCIMWGMDGFLNGNFILCYDRGSKTIEHLHKTAGYMFYSATTSLGEGKVAVFNNHGVPSTIYMAHGRKITEIFKYPVSHAYVTFVPLSDGRIIMNGDGVLPKADGSGMIQSAVIKFTAR